MRRSLLFLPGNNPAILNNADVFDCDCVIFDLEDAVSIDEKDAARSLVVQALKTFEHTKIERLVRLNGVDTSLFQADLAALLEAKPDGLMIPKATIESVTYVNQQIDALDAHSSILLFPLVESPKGVLEVQTIATLPRVKGILFGGEDFAQSMQIERTKEGWEIFTARSLVAMACKAASIDAFDTPFTDTFDEVGLRKDALLAKQLGMSGKACIHPNQIAVVQAVFSPSEQAIFQARRIVKAFEEHQKQNKGVFSLDGKMVDKPIYERAKHLLEEAQHLGLWRESNEK